MTYASRGSSTSAAFLVAMRFVQLADTHLDSSISGAIGLSREQSKTLINDVRAAFARGCALAVDRKADLVLIPGDLFDYETAGPDTAAFIHRTLAEVAPIPVFIAPGNHDSLRAGSPYNGQWPANVHIFRSPHFSTVDHESGCSITGIGHAHRGFTDRLLSKPLPAGLCPTRILLFHGSRDGYRPSEKETVIPFSDSELVGQSFTYAAIGHYHSFGAISDKKGIRGAYSGCAQGRGLDETGEKCVLVGEIRLDGTVELERIEVAERRILRVEANVTGARDGAEALARLDAAIPAIARPCDIVCAFLKGRLGRDSSVDETAWLSRQPYFASTLSTSAIEPDHDLGAIAQDSAASSVRSTFVRKMLDRQRSAPDEEQKLMLRDAIYYGLDALDGRKPEPRDAD